MAQIDEQVGADTDDGFETDDTSWSTDWGAIYVGAYDSEVYDMGIRFTGVTLPQGSTIIASYLELYISTADATLASLVYGVDEDNPDAFNSTTRRPSQLTKTSASVAWDGNSNTGWVQTPSLNSIFSELTTSYDFNNEAMAFIVLDNGSGDYTEATDYGGNSSLAPKLHIEYTVFRPHIISY